MNAVFGNTERVLVMAELDLLSSTSFLLVRVAYRDRTGRTLPNDLAVAADLLLEATETIPLTQLEARALVRGYLRRKEDQK